MHHAASEPQPVTRLLEAHAQGDSEALGELFRLLYRELTLVARRQRRRLGAGPTLDTVGLVHDCYVKLLGSAAPRDRGHFFSVAANAMRHLLVDYARARNRQKRRGDIVDVEVDEVAAPDHDELERILTVNAALEKLQEIDPRLVQVTECRFFAGLSVPETAEALGISVSTVERAWRAVRKYLADAMAD